LLVEIKLYYNLLGNPKLTCNSSWNVAAF